MSEELPDWEILAGTNFQDQFAMDAVRTRGVVTAENWTPGKKVEIPLLNLPYTKKRTRAVDGKTCVSRVITRGVYALV